MVIYGAVCDVVAIAVPDEHDLFLLTVQRGYDALVWVALCRDDMFEHAEQEG